MRSEGDIRSESGSPSVKLSPGDLVTPQLRLIRLLGHGGMGSVWVAEHLRLKTEVAVKFILGDYARHPEALARFEREATLAAQAKSPHVVQVFDHGVTDQGVPYISMELLHGHDLASQIEREGRLDPAVFCDYFRQAATGLGRAHQKGIVHRDVKPDNIFLCDEDGEVLVKVLDFGVAKAGTQSAGFSGTQTGALMGTAYYMSPEQTMGKKDLDARTDLWALGVVAYYALTGVRPFDGAAIGELVYAIAGGRPKPPSEVNPALPPALDGWMERALAKVPADRFSSAKEMAAALELALTGQERVRSGVPSSGQTTTAGLPPGTVRSATTLSPATTAAPESKDADDVPLQGMLRRLPWAWVGAAATLSLGALLWAVQDPTPAPAALVPSDAMAPSQSPAASSPTVAELPDAAGLAEAGVAPADAPEPAADPEPTIQQSDEGSKAPEMKPRTTPSIAATTATATPGSAARLPARPASKPTPPPSPPPNPEPPKNSLHMQLQ